MLQCRARGASRARTRCLRARALRRAAAATHSTQASRTCWRPAACAGWAAVAPPGALHALGTHATAPPRRPPPQAAAAVGGAQCAALLSPAAPSNGQAASCWGFSEHARCRGLQHCHARHNGKGQLGGSDHQCDALHSFLYFMHPAIHHTTHKQRNTLLLSPNAHARATSASHSNQLCSWRRPCACACALSCINGAFSTT